MEGIACGRALGRDPHALLGLPRSPDDGGVRELLPLLDGRGLAVLARVHDRRLAGVVGVMEQTFFFLLSKKLKVGTRISDFQNRV